jgi:hypothetical protein
MKQAVQLTMQSLGSTLCLKPIAKHTLILAELELIRVLPDSVHTHASHIQLQETITLDTFTGCWYACKLAFEGTLCTDLPTEAEDGARDRPPEEL